MTAADRSNGLPQAIPVVNPELFPAPGADPVEGLRDQPTVRSTMDRTPKGLVEYVVDHNRHALPMLRTVHKSKLLHVLNDLRDRNSPENREFEQRLIPDVAENGIRVPLIGYEEGDSIRLIDGETRFRALLLGPRETAQVLLYAEKPSEAEVKLAGLLCNSMRQDMGDLEYARVYAELMKLNGWTQAELGRRTHTHASTITKRLAISSKLSPEVQAMVAAGEVPPRAAYAISRLSEVPVQIALADKVRRGLLCVEGVESQVIKLLGKRDAKAKPMKLSHGGVTAVVKGAGAIEAIQAFMAKVADAIKRLQRESLSSELLPALAGRSDYATRDVATSGQLTEGGTMAESNALKKFLDRMHAVSENFGAWIKDNDAKLPKLGAELEALGREMVKDIRGTIHQAFLNQPEHASESGTPLNPTPQLITEGLTGKDIYGRGNEKGKEARAKEEIEMG